MISPEKKRIPCGSRLPGCIHPHAFLLHLQEPQSIKGCAQTVFKLLFDVISPGSSTPTTPSCLERCCRALYLLLLPPHDLLPLWTSHRKGTGCTRTLARLLVTRVHPKFALNCCLCYGVQKRSHFKGYSECGPVAVWTHGWSDAYIYFYL